jgi:transposase
VSFYLVAGQGASIAPARTGQHLPTRRPRRYPSDTDDEEWQIMAPYVPVGGTTVQGGCAVTYPRRDIVDAIRYVDRTSCQWRALPVDFPLWPIVYHYFRKRHIVVDTCGLLLVVMVTAANVQNRDAARTLLWALRTCFATIRLLWADGGYSGQLVTWAQHTLALTVQIVRKLTGQHTFVVLSRRWVAERTFAWINRCRRTVRDYERLPAHHAAMVQWSMVIIMTRRPARHRRNTHRLPPIFAA